MRNLGGFPLGERIRADGRFQMAENALLKWLATLTVLRLDQTATQSGPSVWSISRKSRETGPFCVVFGGQKLPSRGHTNLPNGMSKIARERETPRGSLYQRLSAGP